ncbi:multicomponent Na+:H+ antiporter subunit G [Thermocatellispora tengchongensis]|uniref:Multicomponent Na+:H+ antiporter subunit G n=1 Tax=Thermocatellispora tengchongensis TaxID=1073253 RepID=A0A840NYZ1_9ACTN|nr:monovalent cation/H(+) antiporter subunit G [Thermocatellispora tengchongensis]MBB5130350.1 multicomponent Na+:H+ antiporter subunit G [Thermocatellispora tengchongensis]
MSDLVAGALLLVGAVLSLTAGIGLLRFPTLLSRLHLGAKPQVIGMVLTLVAVGLRTDAPLDIGILALTGLFQLVTGPVAAHMIGRGAYRSGLVRRDLLLTDELADDLADDRGQESS